MQIWGIMLSLRVQKSAWENLVCIIYSFYLFLVRVCTNILVSWVAIMHPKRMFVYHIIVDEHNSGWTLLRSLLSVSATIGLNDTDNHPDNWWPHCGHHSWHQTGCNSSRITYYSGKVVHLRFISRNCLQRFQIFDQGSQKCQKNGRNDVAISLVFLRVFGLLTCFCN